MAADSPTQQSAPAAETKTAPDSAPVAPETGSNRPDAPARLNLVWILLCLVPVFTVLLVASFDVVDSIRLDTPAAEAQRIATRAPMPVLWQQTEEQFLNSSEALTGPALDGMVVLGSTRSEGAAAVAEGMPLLSLYFLRPPASDPIPQLTVLPAAADLRLRYGDVVAIAETDPGNQPEGSTIPTILFHGGVFDSTYRRDERGIDEALVANMPTALAAAASNALLRAEAAGLVSIAFAYPANPYPLFSSAEDEQWSHRVLLQAVQTAVNRTAPYLKTLRRVRVVATTSMPFQQQQVPRQQQIAPQTQQQQQQAPITQSQKEPPEPKSSVAQMPAVQEPEIPTQSEEPASPTPDDTPRTQGPPAYRSGSKQLLTEVLANLERTAGTALPWQEAAQVFSAGLEEPRAVTANNIDIETDNTFNPIAWTEGRVTYVPAMLFWASFVLIVAVQIRRREPGKLRGNNLRGAIVSGALSTGGAIWVLGSLESWWIAGLGLGPIDAIEAGVPLLLASAAAVAIGFAGGQLTFVTAWPYHPRSAAAEEIPEEQEALRAVLHRDVPITDASADKLGFDALAEALAKFIDNKSTAPPLVLAVNGPWGAGKSSIMKLLTQKLRGTERFKIAWFNAWKYQTEEQILAAFLSTIAKDLSRDWGALFSLKLALVRLKHASFTQLLLLSAPFLLIFIAYQAPHWIEDFITFFGPDQRDDSLTGTLAAVAGETVPLVSGAGGLAGLLWIARFFLPFQMHYRRLFARRDVSTQIGFLDQFEREFRLYREAVDHDKFLIVIDDLDRCHPDAVVEVLKTINLIVTSDTGSGKTFFVLGFDPQYVVQSIELHFKDFAKAADLEGGRFGQQYLKKIVTIGVSVPEPAPEALQDLAVSLNAVKSETQSDTKPTTSRWRRGKDVAAARLRAVPRPLASFALFVALVVALAIWDQPAVTVPDGAPAADPPGEILRTGQDESAGKEDPDGFNPNLESVAALELPEPQRGLFDWIALAATALALVGLLSVFYGLLKSTVRTHKAPPEPDDSRDFQEALVAHQALLPSNPRDLVRTVNRLRVAHLIQTPPETAPERYRDPFGGTPLDARDSVLLNLLQQARPELFAPRFIEALTDDGGQASADLAARLEELVDADGGYKKRALDFAELAQSVKGAADAILDRAKLQRFLAVNRFVLQRYETAPAPEANHGDETRSAPTEEASGEPQAADVPPKAAE